jgi:hypothetical protein
MWIVATSHPPRQDTTTRLDRSASRETSVRTSLALIPPERSPSPVYRSTTRRLPAVRVSRAPAPLATNDLDSEPGGSEAGGSRTQRPMRWKTTEELFGEREAVPCPPRASSSRAAPAGQPRQRRGGGGCGGAVGAPIDTPTTVSIAECSRNRACRKGFCLISLFNWHLSSRPVAARVYVVTEIKIKHVRCCEFWDRNLTGSQSQSQGWWYVGWAGYYSSRSLTCFLHGGHVVIYLLLWLCFDSLTFYWLGKWPRICMS